VATSAVPTSATGKIAACGLEHIVAPHVQRNKQVDYELTTSSRSRAVSTVKAANASSRSASSQTQWLVPRASATNDIALARILCLRVSWSLVYPHFSSRNRWA